jgi:hypothetical protein
MNEDDVYSDYSHYCDGTGPYKRVDYLEYTHICDGCYEIVDSVDTDTGLCETCEFEFRQEQYYKHGIGEPHGEEP